MSMYNLIKSLDLRDDLPKPKLYSNIKLISDYLDDNISIINKPELIKIIRGLKLYLSNKNLLYSNVYKFGVNEIKLDTEQLKIVNSEPNQRGRFQMISSDSLIDAYRFNPDFKVDRGFETPAAPAP